MKVWQTVTHISEKTGDCLVQSARGNSYPVQMNNFSGIEVGDKVQVTKSLSGRWIIINVNHYPEHLDITDFPKDSDGCLNWIAYCEYLEGIEGMKPSERVEFDNYLKGKWGNTQ